ncbi:MAG: hypothetical protein CVV49_16605 [Spirochaetae bacterium HGW-Spirochaetae-5]|nr:MAG: hypothetical protein CVV49_16605 [Spirochaetae bacterium HGW-Spirochaetae-5]
MFFLYTHDVYNDGSANIDNPLIADAEIDFDSDEKFNGNISISYVNRFIGGAFGFGIRKPEGTDQLLSSESSFSMRGIYIPGFIPVKNETIEKKNAFALSTVFSYSKDFGRNEYVGLQFETGYSDSTVKKEKSGTGGSIVDYDMEISTRDLIGNLNCGYNYKWDDFEFGAIIKFGEYKYRKQEYSYSDNILAGNNKDDDVSPYLFKSKGIEYTLGMGYRISHNLTFDFEITAGLPFDKKNKKLKDDDNGVMASENSREYVNYTAGAAGGFNYKFSKDLKIGLGGNAGIYSADVTDHEHLKIEEFTYNVYSLLTGAEYSPVEGINIILGTSLYYLMLNKKSESGSQSIKIEIQTLYLNALAGVSMYY